MAVTYATVVKTARMQAVADQIDGGSGSPAAGKLIIGTAAMGTVLAIVPFVVPCGTVSGDTLTFDYDPDISVFAIATGTAAAATIVDSDGTTLISGLTVGTSGANVNLTNLSIAEHQEVKITSGTIQHAA
jgi:hypothetical protein